MAPSHPSPPILSLPFFLYRSRELEGEENPRATRSTSNTLASSREFSRGFRAATDTEKKKVIGGREIGLCVEESDRDGLFGRTRKIKTIPGNTRRIIPPIKRSRAFALSRIFVAAALDARRVKLSGNGRAARRGAARRGATTRVSEECRTIKVQRTA